MIKLPGEIRMLKERVSMADPSSKNLLVKAIATDCKTAPLMALNRYLLQSTKEN